MKESDAEKRMADYLSGGEAVQEAAPAADGARDPEMERCVKELEALAAKRLDSCGESSAERARAMLEESWNEFEAGRSGEALRLIESALMAFLRGGASDMLGMATAFYSAAYIHVEEERFEEAVRALDDAEMWHDRSRTKPAPGDEDNVRMHMILRKRARAFNYMNEHPRACEDMRRALIAIIKDRGLNDELVGEYYCAYGRYLMDAERTEEAYRQFIDAISLYERMIEKHGYSVVVHPGGARPEKGKPFILYEDLREAYELVVLACAELGWAGLVLSYNDDLLNHTIDCGVNNPEIIAALLNTRGMALISVTDYPAAWEAFRDASEIMLVQEPGQSRDMLLADAFSGIAGAAIELRETATCESALERAAELYLGRLTAENIRPIRELIKLCGEYSVRLGDRMASLKLYSRTIETAAACRVDDPAYLGKLYYSAALELGASGMMEAASEHFRRSAEFYREAGRSDLAERSMKEYENIKTLLDRR